VWRRSGGVHRKFLAFEWFSKKSTTEETAGGGRYAVARAEQLFWRSPRPKKLRGIHSSREISLDRKSQGGRAKVRKSRLIKSTFLGGHFSKKELRGRASAAKD